MKLVCKSFDMSAVIKMEGGNLQPATIRRYQGTKINPLIIKHLGSILEIL
jgi:hypothetical protein